LFGNSFSYFKEMAAGRGEFGKIGQAGANPTSGRIRQKGKEAIGGIYLKRATAELEGDPALGNGNEAGNP
jgi:hypothetical protein